MIRFKGRRVPIEEADNNIVIFSTDNKIWANVPLYLDEVNHSPTGFEWGYRGSGPAQLSYAILRIFCTFFLKDPAQDIPRHYYMRFKDEVIGAIKTEEWEIDGEFILNWLSYKSAFTHEFA